MAIGQNKFETFDTQKKFLDLRTGICMGYMDTGDLNCTPILLLHGNTGTSQRMIEELKRFNPDMRILAPDLSRHGESLMPESNASWNAQENCFDPAQFSTDIIDLMDQLCIDRVYVVGHGMGSVIAKTLALNYPERVIRIVLAGKFVGSRDRDANHNFLIDDLTEEDWRCELEEQSEINWSVDAYSVMIINMEEKVIDYLKENWVVEPGASKDFVESIFPETLRIPLEPWIGAVRALQEIDYGKAFENLKIVTLILWSTQDGSATSEGQKEVKTAFQLSVENNCTKVIYKTYRAVPVSSRGNALNELGHSIMKDKSTEFITPGNPVDAKELLTDEVIAIEDLE